MPDPNPTPTLSDAVDTIVNRFVTQLQESGTVAKQEQSQLTALRRQTKDPELRKGIDVALKDQAVQAGDAAALAKQVQSVSNQMLVDLKLLIEVATQGF